MIRHEDVGVNLPAGLGAHLGEGFDPALAGLAIRIFPEDRLAAVAAIDDVVDRAGILDSQLAGHDGRVARTASCGNIKNCRAVYGSGGTGTGDKLSAVHRVKRMRCRFSARARFVREPPKTAFRSRPSTSSFLLEYKFPRWVEV